MFSLCLRGKQSNCFPGKHELYMFSTSVFLEYRDDPQQWESCNLISATIIMLINATCFFHEQLIMLSISIMSAPAFLLY